MPKSAGASPRAGVESVRLPPPRKRGGIRRFLSSEEEDWSVKPTRGEMSANGRMTITKVAAQLGISTKTILRWEQAGKIRKARRDWRGWRVYEPEEINELKGFFETVY